MQVDFDLGRSLTRGATTALLLFATVVSLRTYLSQSFQDRYSREDLVVERTLLGEPVESVVLQESGPNPVSKRQGEDPLERIRRRGVIRIGFDSDKIPFCYRHADGKLVGFDIDMAHQLARDLDVRIEFVPFVGRVSKLLLSDHFDVAMSGVGGSVHRAAQLPDMEPYLEVTRALVVPDHRRQEINSLVCEKTDRRGRAVASASPPLREVSNPRVPRRIHRWEQPGPR